MKIKFKAMQKNGDLTIESYDIKQERNVFNDSEFYLWHVCFQKEQSDKGMWIEIDALTLEIIK